MDATFGRRKCSLIQQLCWVSSTAFPILELQNTRLCRLAHASYWHRNNKTLPDVCSPALVTTVLPPLHNWLYCYHACQTAARMVADWGSAFRAASLTRLNCTHISYGYSWIVVSLIVSTSKLRMHNKNHVNGRVDLVMSRLFSWALLLFCFVGLHQLSS